MMCLIGGKSSHFGFIESIPHAVSNLHNNHFLGGIGKKGNLYHQFFLLTVHPYFSNVIEVLIVLNSSPNYYKIQVSLAQTQDWTIQSFHPRIYRHILRAIHTEYHYDLPNQR